MDSDLGICNWMDIVCKVVLTYTIITAFAIGGCNGWGDIPYEEHEDHGNAKYVHVPQTLGNTQIRLHRTTQRGWSMGTWRLEPLRDKTVYDSVAFRLNSILPINRK